MKKPKSKYTKQQRNKIYKEALVSLEEAILTKGSLFCCCAIANLIIHWPKEKDFPEFFTLKPIDLDSGDLWFKENKKGNNQRITTMLFAIEMSN